MAVLRGRHLATGMLAALLAAAGSPAATAGTPTATVTPPSDPATLVNDPSVDTTTRATQRRPAVTVAGQNVVVAYLDTGTTVAAPNQQTGWSVSTDGGQTFTDRGRLPASGSGDGGDSALATDTSTGRVYLATEAFESRGRMQLFRSDDGGISFRPPVNATPGIYTPAEVTDPTIAVDNFAGPCRGNVYLGLTYGRPTPKAPWFSRSTDGGATFGPSGGIALGAPYSSAPDLVVGPDHQVHYVWSYGGVSMRTSTDCGQTFGPPVVVTDESAFTPDVAVDPVTGTLVVAYTQWDGVRRDVRYVTSTDGGATWSEPAGLATGEEGTRFEPSVAIAPDGRRMMASWYDDRNDPLGVLTQRYGRTAAIAGGTLSFNAEMVLSPAFPLSTPVDRSAALWDEDHDALVATADGFLAAWGDTRDGDAFANHQFDVRIARVPARGAADVSVALRTPAAAVAQGDHAEITATVANRRLTAADGVFVHVDLARGLIGEAATVPGGACTGGPVVVCRVGRLAPGQRARVVISALGVAPGEVAVRAIATTGTRDPDQADNEVTSPVTVVPGSTRQVVDGTGDIVRPLPDRSFVEVLFAADDPGRIADVDASVRLDHSFGHDLVIVLVSPEGTTVTLAERRGVRGGYGTGTGDCAGTPTTFDDDAATAIADGTNPFAGSYRPDEPLGRMTGEPAAGTWRLQISDRAQHDVGTLYCVGLDLDVTP